MRCAPGGSRADLQSQFRSIPRDKVDPYGGEIAHLVLQPGEEVISTWNARNRLPRAGVATGPAGGPTDNAGYPGPETPGGGIAGRALRGEERRGVIMPAVRNRA